MNEEYPGKLQEYGEFTEGQKAVISQIAEIAAQKTLEAWMYNYYMRCPAVKWVAKAKYWTVGLICASIGFGFGAGMLTAQQIARAIAAAT